MLVRQLRAANNGDGLLIFDGTQTEPYDDGIAARDAMSIFHFLVGLLPAPTYNELSKLMFATEATQEDLEMMYAISNGDGEKNSDGDEDSPVDL